MDNFRGAREVVLEVTNLIVTSDMKVIGVTMRSMDLENYSGTMSFSFRENFRMDLNMVLGSTNMKMVIFLMVISSGTREEVMVVTILLKEECYSLSSILCLRRYLS